MSRWPLTLRGTGAVVLAIVCFIVAHEIKVTELLYVSALLLVGVGASVATVYLVRRTEKVTRAFSPDVATVGRDVDVTLRVEIRSPLPSAQGRWRDTLPRGVDGDAHGVFPETGSGMRAAGRTIELAYTATAQRRGIRSVGPLSVTSTDPFGFARRRHTIGAVVPLTVVPVIADFGPLAEQPGEAGGSMHSANDHMGQGSDNLIPRHYIPGDSRRRIHWRASAHRDQLMVRQEEQETNPEATVVLDRGVLRWTMDALREPGADPGFEAAVSVCVSAVARLVQEGYLVTVCDLDGTPLGVPIDGGDAAGVEQLTVDLATTTAHRGPGLDALVRLFSGTTTGPLVLITGLIEPADAATLAPLAHHSTLPILLSVAPHGDALSHAADAGWRVGAVPPDRDPAPVWNAAVDRGFSRAGA